VGILSKKDEEKKKDKRESGPKNKEGMDIVFVWY